MTVDFEFGGIQFRATGNYTTGISGGWEDVSYGSEFELLTLHSDENLADFVYNTNKSTYDDIIEAILIKIEE
jgi:hypothetical protein